MTQTMQPIPTALRPSPPQHPQSFSKPPERPEMPVLRFTPTAWAKLQFFCRYGETEIGGFGVTSPQDPLLVEDLALKSVAA